MASSPLLSVQLLISRPNLSKEEHQILDISLVCLALVLDYVVHIQYHGARLGFIEIGCICTGSLFRLILFCHFSP